MEKSYEKQKKYVLDEIACLFPGVTFWIGFKFLHEIFDI